MMMVKMAWNHQLPHNTHTVLSIHHYPQLAFKAEGPWERQQDLKEQAASNFTLHNICLHLSSQGKATVDICYTSDLK